MFYHEGRELHMKFMHTRLPDFFTKVIAAAKQKNPDMEVTVSGLESVKTAKLASLRVGRVEDEITDLVNDPEVKRIEVQLVPTNPETLYTVISKGITEDGTVKTAILENMMLSQPTVEYHIIGAKEVVDRRANIKK